MNRSFTFRMPTHAKWLTTLLLSAFVAQPAIANRELIESDQYRLSTREESCQRTMTLDIDARNANILHADHPQLKRVVALARTVLGYECNNLTQFDINGYDADSGENRFSGRAQRRNNWRIESNTQTSNNNTSNNTSSLDSSHYTIAGIHGGMSLIDARRALWDAFDSEPVFRKNRSVLRAGDDGCFRRQQQSQLRTGDRRCVRVWLTDEQSPTVKRVMMIQTVSGNQADQGFEVLKSRFGEPRERYRAKPQDRPWAQAYSEVTRLKWGSAIDTRRNNSNNKNNDVGTHPLEADIATDRLTTMLVVRLRASGDNRSTPNPFEF